MNYILTTDFAGSCRDWRETCPGIPAGNTVDYAWI